MSLYSWGRIAPARPAATIAVSDRHAVRLPATGRTRLAYGAGRSYGDVCFNDGGDLLLTRGLNRFIAFDDVRGVLRAEAGATLHDVLRVTLPRGWIPEVLPGTRFVTLGGAVANDVHGKNHHRVGTFGRHVLALGILRSDGSSHRCSLNENTALFKATIGGLGLTGLILWVEMRLRRIASASVHVRRTRFETLDEYWALDEQARNGHEFSVAWIDSAHGERGLHFSGDFCDGEGAPAVTGRSAPRFTMPFSPPLSLVNRLTTRVFNTLYLDASRPSEYTSAAYGYFFPLDSIGEWNRAYGVRGLYQYQCVLPPDSMKEAVRAIFLMIRRSGQGSFLNVLKTFGAVESPGLISFPRAGTTIAMDFPNRGDASLRLFDALDRIVCEAGGALYPAKDMRMNRAVFESGYPALGTFVEQLDPGFSSNFWRRVTG